MKHNQARQAYRWMQIFLMLVSTACGKANHDSSLSDRIAADNSFFSVGLVTYENLHRCTATIVKHGLALTAKHCFQLDEIKDNNLRKVGINFRHASETDRNPLFVDGTKIKQIVFDGPTNDIAYILYDSTATLRLKLDLPLIQNPLLPKKNEVTAVVG